MVMAKVERKGTSTAPKNEPSPLSSAHRNSGVVKLAVQEEIGFIKEETQIIRGAVLLLEKEKDSLRQAVRKLKLENAHVKQKVKRLQETVNELTTELKGDTNQKMGVEEAELDYDDIGRDFILVGGVQDPLSIRFEVTFRDDANVEHKSAERYYWYKMAELFTDAEAMAEILDAPDFKKAEEAMKKIKNFKDDVWNEVKVKVWEDGQRLKLSQARWISNLLVYTDKAYIAVASQDKVFGTGWRKNRNEANKPVFWDGENLGGKALMKIRSELKETHEWTGPYEEEETKKRYIEMKKFVWRRVDPIRRMRVGARRGGASRFATAGGSPPRH